MEHILFWCYVYETAKTARVTVGSQVTVHGLPLHLALSWAKIDELPLLFIIKYSNTIFCKEKQW